MNLVSFIVVAVILYQVFYFRKELYEVLFGALKCIKAQIKFMRKGEEVSTETLAKRLTVCSGCPFENSGVCMECGCILAEKARMSTENCPQNYWDNNAGNLH